jgi:hypothetical protein
VAVLGVPGKNSMDKNWLQRRDNAKYTGKYRCCSRAERLQEEAMTDLFGQDLAPLEIANNRKDMKELKDIAMRIAENIGLHEDNLFAKMELNWSDIVGNHLKDMIRPVAIVGDTLEVEADCSSVSFVFRGGPVLKTLQQNVKKYSN